MNNQKGVNIELIKGTLDDYIIKDKDKIVIGRFTITELDKENKKCNLKLRFYREDNYDLLKVTLEAILKAIFNDSLCASGFKCIGLLCTEQEYKDWKNKHKERRYQPNKPHRRLVSADGIAFYVNTQWTQESIKKIVKMAKEEGMDVEAMKK